MWKFVSRRIRDTFEKGLNHFEKRSSAGVVNSTNNPCDDKKISSSPCLWFCPKTCWGSRTKNDTNRRWSDNINRTWMGAITWSSALVLGWYASQIINLAYKYHRKEKKCKVTVNNNLIIRLCPYANGVNKEALNINTNSRIESIINALVPTVHLISNEFKTEKGNDSSISGSDTTSPGTSNSDLSDVLNSIENKLGLAAIENGQHQDGLNLLRSAATRHYAPALYNLGLCYEMGLGVTVDEKMAMEFYRSAAALEHSGALYNLGIYYGQGRGGLQRNSETAARLLRLAAVQGEQDAIQALKVLNLDVMEPPLDEKAKKWEFLNNDKILPAHTSPFPSCPIISSIKNTYNNIF